MKLVCSKCSKGFPAPAGRAAAVERVLSKGGAPVWLECPHCLHDFFVVQGGDDDEEPPYRCPVLGCDGWVSYVVMKRRAPFYGCGECGCYWRKEQSLYRDITDAVKQYPYRRKSYVKRGKGWLPANPDAESKNYEAKVETEPTEPGVDFDRT